MPLDIPSNANSVNRSMSSGITPLKTNVQQPDSISSLTSNILGSWVSDTSKTAGTNSTNFCYFVDPGLVADQSSKAMQSHFDSKPPAQNALTDKSANLKPTDKAPVYNCNYFKASLGEAKADIKSYKGADVTTSGYWRSIYEAGGAGRSDRSLHYLGRAFDFGINDGMLKEDSKYIVTRDGGTDENPNWKVYCRVNDERVPEQELDQCIWKRGKDPDVKKVKARAICITDIMKEHGWEPISARDGWKKDYMNCEWWHFENREGLIDGKSSFQGELKKIYKKTAIAESPLKDTNGVWRDDTNCFR